MKFADSYLPWTGAPVRRYDKVDEYLSEFLPKSLAKYIPASITLFVDPEISESQVTRFLQSMSLHMQVELERRKGREARFVDLGLAAEDELETFLTARRHVQPWGIYYSGRGGLGNGEASMGEDARARGVIPCSSMRNHGVAWERTASGELRTWLATSRREGQEWDWDSDIGHESAHAAFAQVPFFVQSNPQVPANALSRAEDPSELPPMQVAQMIYLWTEIAVVAFRGEPRPTATGLPVPEPAELQALLRLSALLCENIGFERAASLCERVNGTIDVNQGDEIYYIAAPIIEVLPRLTRFTNDPEPPPLRVFQEVLATASIG